MGIDEPVPIFIFFVALTLSSQRVIITIVTLKNL